MVEFDIRGYGYGYYKVSVDIFFTGMDIQYPYPLPNEYLIYGPSRFIYYHKFLFSIFIHNMLFGAEIII
jgi:hypothetical protein